MRFFIKAPAGGPLVIATLAFTSLLPVPLAANAQSKMPQPINVRTYGAKGDGVADDTAAINAAIAAAEQNGPGAIVVLPHGRYKIASGDAKSVRIEKADHLTLQGESGATLVSANLEEPLVRINNSNGVTVRRLSLDRDPLGYTQGTITSVDIPGMTCDVTIDAGYPSPDAPQLKGSTIHPFVFPKLGYYQLDRYWPEPAKMQQTGPGAWRFTLKGPPAIDNWPGKRFFLMGNGRGHAFDMFEDRDTTIEDVNYWGGGANAGFYIGGLTGATIFRRFVIGVPPGSGRIYSCGGGGQISGLRGTLLFDSCDFSKIDDDGIDILATWTRIVAQPDSKTMRVQVRQDAYQPGDHVEIWDWAHKKKRLEAIVTAATKEADNTYTLVFDREVQTEKVGAGEGPAFGIAAVNDGIDRLIDISTVGQATTIRNCKFQVFRAKCLNLKAANCTVTGCEFRNSFQPAISAAPEWYFEEGPAIRNLVIRNCKFTDCNHSNIDIGAAKPTGVPNEPVAHADAPGNDSRDSRNILIENNSFSGYGAVPSVFPWWTFGALHVTNANGVVIRGNRFGPPAPTAPKTIKPYLIERSDDVHIENNTIVP